MRLLGELARLMLLLRRSVAKVKLRVRTWWAIVQNHDWLGIWYRNPHAWDVASLVN